MKYPARMAVLLFIALAAVTATAGAVEPGKIRVERVDFHGNRSFSEKKLRNLMVVRPPGLFRRTSHSHETLLSDLERIKSFYVNQGFLEAEIRNVTVDSTGNRFRIGITLSEGEVTLVQDVAVSGNTAFTTRGILDAIPIKPGKPLRGGQVTESVAAVLNLYGRKGYITAVVNPDTRVNRDIHRAIVDFILIEGEQYHVAGSDIRGLTKTRPSVVRRGLRFKQGEVVDVARIFQSENDLYAAGLFNSVQIQPLPAPGDSTGRIMTVTVRERKSGEFAVGFGYETVSGFGGTLTVRNNNLFGTGRKVGLNSEFNQKNQTGQASYSNFWTFGHRVRTDITGLVEYNQQQPGFDFRRIGGSYVLGKTVFRHTDASVQLRLESIRNYNIQSSTVTAANEKGNLRSLIPALTYDSRDDYFNTRKGSYIELRNGLVGAFLGGTVSYNSVSLIARNFFPATPSLTIASSLQGSMQNLLGNTLVIPLSERLYTGGPNTLRGYGYQKVGPRDPSGIPLGGRLLLVGSLELRLNVYKIFGAAAFFDSGNVWATPGDFDIRSLRSDYGFGPRFNTPIGAFRIDYARSIHRRTGDGSSQIYFAFGQSF